MSTNGTPRLDTRDAQAMAADFLARLPGYVPGWAPVEGGPSWAVVQAYARYMQALAERLGLAPDKNKLAFLDMLGINLLSAQAARAPLVFKALSHTGDGRVPARTQVGATVAGRDDPLIFETEKTIALASAQLAEVVTLWPGKDAYADHSAEAIGGQPFTLFESLKPVPHELYLAHDTYFALSSEAKVELQFDLARPGSEPLTIVWEYWDGDVWRAFKEFAKPDEAGESDSLDGSEGLTRSGIIRLAADCAETKRTTVNGVESYWVRGRLAEPFPPRPEVAPALVSQINVRTVITRPFADGLVPDVAFADGVELDMARSFYPFGQQPQPGAAFYFASEEAFGKPGNQITLGADDAKTPQDDTGATPTTPTLVAEYWNGRRWTTLSGLTNLDTFVTGGGVRQFRIPDDLSTYTVNNQEAYWLRLRIVNGGFVRTNTIQWTDEASGETNTITVVETVPPALAALPLRYDYASPWSQPQWCATYGDFQWVDRSEEARWRGQTFEPFSVVTDRTPTLYLGFDKVLPADLISIYLDIQEVTGRTSGPALQWEYWDNSAWLPLTVQDETMDLALPGIVDVVWPGTAPLPAAEVIAAAGSEMQMVSTQQAAQFRPGDLLYVGEDEDGELVTLAGVNRRTLTLKTPLRNAYTRVMVRRARLPRFGAPRTWLRARLQNDGEPLKSQLNGVHFNAVWAAQIQTIENEALGGSDGRSDQVFFLRQTPVLHGEVVEVRELSGPRAAVELPILQEALTQEGLDEDAIRIVKEPRSGAVSEVWVRWQPRPNFFFSGPDDRHYVMERSQGRLIFGDGRHGRIPPAGRDNIRVQSYRSGGGQIGNVPAGSLTQLLSGVPVESVTNPRAAEGGADGEPLRAVHSRGPQVLRHRYQAISLADYEALAREASPAVAVARALPATHASGRPAPGWVRLIIMPHSQEPRPQPSFGLRRQVQSYLAARVPAGIASQVSVQGPAYLPIGVEAMIAPVDPTRAGPVLEAVAAALAEFLHPLNGGPEGSGWPFGRDVYLSDVAAVLEAVHGVDYVQTLNLLLENTPQGETVAVPPQRIVVAGPLQLTLATR